MPNPRTPTPEHPTPKRNDLVTYKGQTYRVIGHGPGNAAGGRVLLQHVDERGTKVGLTAMAKDVVLVSPRASARSATAQRRGPGHDALDLEDLSPTADDEATHRAARKAGAGR